MTVNAMTGRWWARVALVGAGMLLAASCDLWSTPVSSSAPDSTACCSQIGGTHWDCDVAITLETAYGWGDGDPDAPAGSICHQNAQVCAVSVLEAQRAAPDQVAGGKLLGLLQRVQCMPKDCPQYHSAVHPTEQGPLLTCDTAPPMPPCVLAAGSCADCINGQCCDAYAKCVTVAGKDACDREVGYWLGTSPAPPAGTPGVAEMELCFATDCGNTCDPNALRLHDAGAW